MADLKPSLRALAVTLTQHASAARPPETTPLSRPEHSANSGVLAASNLDLNEILRMPLDQFMRDGQLLEVRVPWLNVTLWFVPAERDAERLAAEGIGRGRIWTATELAHLLSMPDPTPAIVATLARAKLTVGGDIVEVRPR
ncbi:MAG: hypothetical protein C5B48_08465 [Candidatus Rokuibacteriota bacterium]|nr:MAG: hypothetical protein C5B48_08465 [Candidatus Rokubacteria bacterium]